MGGETSSCLDPGRPRVLVVEDDDGLRTAMVGCLARAGFAVSSVGTGADAVAAARAVRPDAMVIDVVLPDAGGLGVANEVWRDRDLKSVPVLFTTALSNPVVRTLLAPAQVLFKPFSKRQLLSWVRSATRAVPARLGWP
ncbi:MAG TPA: response regulator [Anaeromyxobacter sp.]|nr:response regulator [Anaeromyxobacter sp.]